MSVAVARPLRSPRARARAPLHAVEPRFRPRPNFIRAALVLAALGAIFGAQLLLSIVVSSGQYEIAALQSQQKELDRTAESLLESLQTLSSTQHLADNAVALGMVQGTGAAYLRLSDGAVITAPGATPRYDCTGSCGLVANDLLRGVPIVKAGPPATAATGATTTAATGTTTASTPVTPTADQPATGTIPAPVTR